jgi:hypothetical protein
LSVILFHCGPPSPNGHFPGSTGSPPASARDEQESVSCLVVSPAQRAVGMAVAAGFRLLLPISAGLARRTRRQLCCTKTRCPRVGSASLLVAPSTTRTPRPLPHLPVPLPLPGTEDFWLALAACYLPELVRPLLEDGLRQIVRARACWGQTGTLWPDERPNEPPEWRRFGIYGEQLAPKPWLEMQRLLVKEVKRMVHTLEASDLSRQERSWRLLLHGARLGQLYADLARRSDARAASEALRQALAALLA